MKNRTVLIAESYISKIEKFKQRPERDEILDSIKSALSEDSSKDQVIEIFEEAMNKVIQSKTYGPKGYADHFITQCLSLIKILDKYGLENLPPEIMLHILSYLNCKAHASVARVSSYTNSFYKKPHSRFNIISTKWYNDFPEATIVIDLPLHNACAVGTVNGKVFILSHRKNSRIASIEVDGEVSALATLEGKLIVGTNNGSLSMWDVNTLKLLAQHDSLLEEVIQHIVILNNNQILVSYNNNLYLYSIDHKNYSNPLQDRKYLLSENKIETIVALSDKQILIGGNDLLLCDVESDLAKNNSIRINTHSKVLALAKQTDLLMVAFDNNEVVLTDLASLKKGELVPKATFHPTLHHNEFITNIIILGENDFFYATNVSGYIYDTQHVDSPMDMSGLATANVKNPGGKSIVGSFMHNYSIFCFTKNLNTKIIDFPCQLDDHSENKLKNFK